MRNKLGSWLDLFGGLGRALLRLFEAEIAALTGDLKDSGRGLGRALLLLVACLFVLFWAVGALGYVLVEVATLWLPRWGAAVAVLALLLLTALTLGAIGWRLLRRLETPAVTFKKRLESHREWWEARVGSSRPLAGGAERSLDAAGADPPEGDRLD